MGWGKDWITDGNLIIKEAKRADIETTLTDVIKRNNMSPTHDPYANPNAHIYYEWRNPRP